VKQDQFLLLLKKKYTDSKINEGTYEIIHKKFSGY
jgi:hypothetical protein